MGGTIFDKLWCNIKGIIGQLSFKIFLWSINCSENEYISNIYEQEKNLLGNLNDQ